MHLWVKPADREQKSADVERKTVTLIYPYPSFWVSTQQILPHSIGGLVSPVPVELRRAQHGFGEDGQESDGLDEGVDPDHQVHDQAEKQTDSGLALPVDEL
jgi:hypothetical protein